MLQRKITEQYKTANQVSRGSPNRKRFMPGMTRIDSLNFLQKSQRLKERDLSTPLYQYKKQSSNRIGYPATSIVKYKQDQSRNMDLIGL